MTTVIPLLNYNGTQFGVEVSKFEDKVKSYTLVENKTVLENDSIKSLSNLIVIDSTGSGTGRTSETDFYTIVIEPILKRLIGDDYKYIRTDSKDTIKEFASQFALVPETQYDILFFSGDTSISEFINSLQSMVLLQKSGNVSILPIPLGTGNALASSLGFKCPVTTFQKYLCNKLTSSPLPIYELVLPDQSSFYFFVILSMGFHANLLHCAEDPKYKKMGVERFRKASETVSQNYELAVDISLRTDSDFHKFAYFALINTSHLEPSYIPSPKSSVIKPELHILGYDSDLSKSVLFDKILKGYNNTNETDISENGTMYDPINDNLVVVVKNDTEAPDYRYELCCDGELFNLRNFPNTDPVYRLSINFIPKSCLKIYN